MTCKECKFWEEIKEEPKIAENNGIVRGYCHRYPPVPTPLAMPVVNKITQQVIPQITEMSIWPMTQSIQWCGEGIKGNKWVRATGTGR